MSTGKGFSLGVISLKDVHNYFLKALEGGVSGACRGYSKCWLGQAVYQLI